MPVSASRVTIPNGSSVLLAAADNMSQDVAITNTNADNPIFIDGTDQVSSGQGFTIKAEESLSITLGPGDELYALATAAGVEANIIVVRAD